MADFENEKRQKKTPTFLAFKKHVVFVFVFVLFSYRSFTESKFENHSSGVLILQKIHHDLGVVRKRKSD